MDSMHPVRRGRREGGPAHRPPFTRWPMYGNAMSQSAALARTMQRVLSVEQNTVVSQAVCPGGPGNQRSPEGMNGSAYWGPVANACPPTPAPPSRPSCAFDQSNRPERATAWAPARRARTFPLRTIPDCKLSTS